MFPEKHKTNKETRVIDSLTNLDYLKNIMLNKQTKKTQEPGASGSYL
jgi:hypothetical protein